MREFMPSDMTIKSDETMRRVSPLYLVALAAMIFASDWGCVMLTAHTGRVAAIWFANAILVASLLKHPRRDWPEMIGVALLAYFSADMLAHDRAIIGLGLSLGNITEVLIVAIPLRWLGFDRVFSRTEVLLFFYALVIGVAAIASSLIAGATLHYVDGENFADIAHSWYGADALGLCLLVPFFMCVKISALKALFDREQLAGTVALLGCVVGVIVICILLPRYSPAFLFFPVLVLLTFKRGFAGGAVGLDVAAAASFTLVFCTAPRPMLRRIRSQSRFPSFSSTIPSWASRSSWRVPRLTIVRSWSAGSQPSSSARRLRARKLSSPRKWRKGPARQNRSSSQT